MGSGLGALGVVMHAGDPCLVGQIVLIRGRHVEVRVGAQLKHAMSEAGPVCLISDQVGRLDPDSRKARVRLRPPTAKKTRIPEAFGFVW